MSAGHPGLKKNPKRWARRMMLDELAELERVGLTCNAQHWASYAVMKDVDECRAARREGRRLLKIAVAAVKAARGGA